MNTIRLVFVTSVVFLCFLSTTTKGDKFAVGDTVIVSVKSTEIWSGGQLKQKLMKGTPFQIAKIQEFWIGGIAATENEKITGWIRRRELTKTNGPVAKRDANEIGVVGFIKSRQNGSGGFIEQINEGKATSADLKATWAAIRTFQILEKEIPNKDRCSRFIISCYHRDDKGFSNLPTGDPDAKSTAFGIMASIDSGILLISKSDAMVRYLDANVKNFKETFVAAEATKILGKDPTNRKTWADKATNVILSQSLALETTDSPAPMASSLLTIRRLNLTHNSKFNSAVLYYFREGKHADGCYGEEGADHSDLESTCRVVEAFRLFNQTPPNAKQIESFVRRCRNEDGGYGITPNDDSSVTATYYALKLRKLLGIALEDFSQ